MCHGQDFFASLCLAVVSLVKRTPLSRSHQWGAGSHHQCEEGCCAGVHLPRWCNF